jgi:HK97 gp10 family phage protein
MPSPISVEFKGLKELQAELEALPEKTGKAVLRKGLRDAGDLIKKAMVHFAPKDTGFLSEHFKTGTKIFKEAISGLVWIGPQGRVYYPFRGDKSRGVSTGRYAKSGGLVPAISVARFCEFGTVKETKRPFMTQAFDQNANKAIDIFVESINESLDEAGK